MRTQRHYFQACHLEKQGDTAGQQKQLELAYHSDPQDPDVLIAMYRLSQPDDTHHKKILARIRRALESVERAIAEDPQDPMWYNHWAWLVSNTEGDFQKAVEYSLRSLELSPDTPSYLDTLGRCYYSAGDLEQAIKYQRQAVAKHPKVQIMRRQLEQFEREQAARRSETKKSQG
jgi:tetratricopeptide (TPR) repeat protein